MGKRKNGEERREKKDRSAGCLAYLSHYDLFYFPKSITQV